MKLIELTETQYEKLMADKARLDWLEDPAKCYHVCIDRQPDGYSIINRHPGKGDVRAAIDIHRLHA